MKRLISAASAIAVAASLAASAFPFGAIAADAVKTYELRPFLDKNGAQASTTISADAIAAGDVSIPVGFYYVENTKDTEGIRAQWTINSADGNASNQNVTFKAYQPGKEYFNSNRTVTWNGSGYETNIIIGFAGSLDEGRRGVVFNNVCEDTAIFGVADKQDSSNCPNAFGYAVWTPEADGSYSYIGANSDDYPVTVFEVNFKQGTPAGTYTLDFVDYHGDPDAPDNSTCQVQAAGQKMNKGNGKLALNGMTIKIEGTNTGTGSGNNTGSGDPDAVASDFIISGKNYTVKPGETFDLEFTVSSGGHKAILGQCVVDIPSELNVDMSKAYSYATSQNGSRYSELGNGNWSVTLKDVDTSDAAPIDDTQPILWAKASVPANAAPGTVYKYGLKKYHIVESSGVGVNDQGVKEFDAVINYGTVTVADDGQGSTPPTVDPGNRPTVSGTVSDFVLTGKDIEVNAGDEAEIEFSVSAGGHKAVLAQCRIDFPSQFEFATSNAYSYTTSARGTKYGMLGDSDWSVTLMDPDTSEASALNESEPIYWTKVKIPAGTPAGKYYYGFKSYHVVESSGVGVNDQGSKEFDAKVVYGCITVKDNGQGSTPPTVDPGTRPTVSGNISDFTLTGKDIEVNPGDDAEIEFSVSAGGHKAVLAQCNLDFPSQIEITTNNAYSYTTSARGVKYSMLGTSEWSVTLMDPDTSEASSLNESEPIYWARIKVPEGTPAGKYYYGFKYYHVVESSGIGVNDQGSKEFDAKVVYGCITVKDNGQGSGSKYILGDADMNGIVDAMDASDILAEYAALSTKAPTTFTKNYEYQRKVSDVNFDGAIDAADASLVLGFYAYLSTTTNPITDMEVWLKAEGIIS